MLLSDLKDGDPDDNRLFLALRAMSSRDSLIDLALPQLQGLEPRRLKAVVTGLLQMQLMQRERVVTAMPVIEIRD